MRRAASRRGCGRRSRRAAPCPRPKRHSARATSMSDLASTISMLSSVEAKSGQPAAISRSSPLSSNASIAAPTPYQPGSITRACAQLNTQGIARRSSIASDFLRLAGREPILRPGDLGDRRRLAEEAAEAVGPVDQSAIGLERRRRELVHRRGEALGIGGGELLGLEAGEQSRRGHRLEIGHRARPRAVFGGDHFALLGDADAALHRARRLGEDRREARSAAAPDRAAAAVEQLHRRDRPFRTPASAQSSRARAARSRSDSRRPCSNRNSRSSLPDGRAPAAIAATSGRLEPGFHDRRRAFEIGDRLEQAGSP